MQGPGFILFTANPSKEVLEETGARKARDIDPNGNDAGHYRHPATGRGKSFA
jgi:hypothetical protein